MMQTKISIAVIALCSVAFLAALAVLSPARGASRADRSNAPQIRLPTPIEVPVTGLSDSNSAKVVELLESIRRGGATEWICPKCDTKQPEKGTCPTCNEELVERRSEIRVLREVKTDVAKSVITFAIASKQVIDTEELARELRRMQVGLKEREIPITALPRLDVDVPTDAPEAEQRVREALERAMLFNSVAVRVDQSKSRAHALVEVGSKPTTFGAVATIVNGLGEGFRLAGVAWAGPCTACSKLEQKAASCPLCWAEAQPTSIQPEDGD